MPRSRELIRDERDPLVLKRNQMRNELKELAEKENLTAGQTERFDNLLSGEKRLSEQISELDKELADSAQDELRSVYNRPGAVAPGDQSGSPNPFASAPAPSGPFAEQRAEARAVLQRSSTVNDEMAERVARMIEADEHDPTAAIYASVAADPDYAEAFRKIGRDPANGHRSFTTRELAAWQRADTAKRALDISGTAAITPTHLDPNILLSDDGALSPFRAVARVETGTVNVWNGVSSQGVTTEWLAEAAEAADGSPAFASPSATAYKLSSFVPVSYEAWDDAANAESALRQLFADEFAQAENVAFTTGNGTTRPRGLITALDANTNVEVETTTSNVFGATDVYNLYEQLPPRFRPRARWGANLGILADIDQMETANGSKQFPDIMAANPTLLRRPVHELSEMDGTITTGSEENVLVVGDFRQYIVYLRVPTAVELIPNLMGTTNGRPTGQRGLFAWSRVGGNVLVDNGFRVLQAHTN